jgi:hypothetical protein
MNKKRVIFELSSSSLIFMLTLTGIIINHSLSMNFILICILFIGSVISIIISILLLLKNRNNIEKVKNLK